MKDLLTSLAAARGLRERGEPFAVATVVKIGGSTYRRPGARMLIGNDGQTWGTISGGCLEREVARQAVERITDGQTQLVSFELGEDDLVLGFGSGCNGSVHVLIEPSSPSNDVLAEFDRLLTRRASAVIATIVATSGQSPMPGDRLVLDASGEATGLENLVGRDSIVRAASALMHADASSDGGCHWRNEVVEVNGETMNVLLEVVLPPIRLLVLGDGHDVDPIVTLAGTMGWPVTVVGRKSIEVLRERFPAADEAVFLMHPEDLLRHVTVDERTAAIVMTHNYARDRTLVESLLDCPVGYIGMLGPAERTARQLDELSQADDGDGAVYPAEGPAHDRIFGPVGLDIGTESPHEIALAAIAEIQAVMHSRQGGHLRYRRSPIHAERLPAASRG